MTTTPRSHSAAVITPLNLPLFPRLCLMLVATADEVEDRMGDLQEVYANNLAAWGEEEALRRYRRDIASCILAIAYRRLENLVLLRFLDRLKALESILAGAFSLALAFVLLSQLVPPPWWMRAGLAHNPGTFLGGNLVEYPFCQGWTDYKGGNRMQAALDTPGAHVTEVGTQEPFRAGSEQNLRVLLPATAQVVAVYCGISQRAAAMDECALRATCGKGVWPALRDEQYSSSRILTVSMLNKTVLGRDHTVGHFWVVWKDGAPPASAKPPPAAPRVGPNPT
ncbi:MAG: hypothetical protein PW843_01025 [Azospirillaceae bacterium]|nr:hypothetical protein [Azospirillaceae bacterium]